MLVITRGYFPAQTSHLFVPPLLLGAAQMSPVQHPEPRRIVASRRSFSSFCGQVAASSLACCMESNLRMKNQAMPNREGRFVAICCYLYLSMMLSEHNHKAINSGCNPHFFWTTEGWPWHIINWGHFGAMFHWSTSQKANRLVTMAGTAADWILGWGLVFSHNSTASQPAVWYK